MNWMLWSAVGTGVAAAACFLKGAFAIDWNGAAWLFCFFVLFAVALVFLLCGLVTA